MNELALVAFAAEKGEHLVSEPRSAGFARFARVFDAPGYLRGLEAPNRAGSRSSCSSSAA